jgi:hypothetical protein
VSNPCDGATDVAAPCSDSLSLRLRVFLP